MIKQRGYSPIVYEPPTTDEPLEMDDYHNYLRVVELIRDIQHGGRADLRAVLHELTVCAATSVPGAEFADITVTAVGSGLISPPYTHRYAALVDDIQRRHREGPCLDAARDRRTVHVDDLSEDTRWPHFRDAVLTRTPIRSLITFCVLGADSPMGTLNLYATRPRAFGTAAFEIGQLYAIQTGLAWEASLRTRSFREAMKCHDVIGQAKGILMERYHLNPVTALDVLKSTSVTENTTIVDAAQDVIDSTRTRPASVTPTRNNAAKDSQPQARSTSR